MASIQSVQKRDRLSPLDVSYLHFERGPAHMHVGSCLIFSGAAPSYEDFVTHIEQRLNLVPRYRQKLAFMPFQQGRPVWVDDPHFNLKYHIRHIALPKPGSVEQFKAQAGRIFSESLDRSKPLWEIYLVEGLDDNRFAVIGKTHHCLVDGVSGVDLTTVLFDVSPEGTEGLKTDFDVWIPEPEPTGSELLLQSLAERANFPARLLKQVRGLIENPGEVVANVTKQLSGLGSVALAGLSPAPSSPLNVAIGPHRRFEWTTTDLNQLKTIKNSLGGTLNDVVLTVVAGALRGFLQSRGEIVDELELKALVPVSIRSKDGSTAMGNQVTVMTAPLPLYEPDPIKRLHIVSEAMSHIKKSGQAVGAKALTELSGFAPTTIVMQASRLQAQQRFFNLLITNVPGPQFPLYLMGKKMVGIYPQVPLSDGQGIAVAVMSYDGKINFGFTADYDSIPDIKVVTKHLNQSIKQLHRLAVESAKKERSKTGAVSSEASWIPKGNVRRRPSKRAKKP